MGVMMQASFWDCPRLDNKKFQWTAYCPAFGIQLLRRTLVLDSLGFGKKKKTSEVRPPAEVVKEIENFAPLPRTVK